MSKPQYLLVMCVWYLPAAEILMTPDCLHDKCTQVRINCCYAETFLCAEFHLMCQIIESVGLSRIALNNQYWYVRVRQPTTHRQNYVLFTIIPNLYAFFLNCFLFIYFYYLYIFIY